MPDKYTSRIRLLLWRLTRRGYRMSDLFLGVLGQPRLAVAAFRHVMQRRSRIVESGLKLSQNRSRAKDAQHQTKAWTREALIEGLSSQFGVFLLAEDDSHVRLGVAEVNMLSVLHWLARTAQSTQIWLGDREVSFATQNFKSLALEAPEVALRYLDPNGKCDTFMIEAHFRQGPSKWVSPNTANTGARALYDDRLETPGLTKLADLLGAPSFAQMVEDREVDLVYTWVNHADPDWAALYSRYKQALSDGANLDELGLQPAAPKPKSADATAMSRFHSNDELRYSLRSVAENLPWVRQIYVLSNCAPPDWLKTSHPGVRWVQHDEVIPARYLPTFSSHVIESFLHKIPGISDRFIYMNDDFFIYRPLKKSFFFGAGGASHAFLEPYAMVSGPMKEGDPDYLNAARNSAELIVQTFGFAPTQLHRHTPYALRRDVLAEMEERWSEQYDAFRRNRFRTAYDLNITSFLYHYYGLATGKSDIGDVKNILVKSQDVRWRMKVSDVSNNSYDTICFNEGGEDTPSSDWHSSIRLFMLSKWRFSAGWER